MAGKTVANESMREIAASATTGRLLRAGKLMTLTTWLRFARWIAGESTTH
jgi:hypothetical protein